jgi:hypothetical protein
MKVLFILLLLISCGKKDKTAPVNGSNGSSCSVTSTSQGALVTCTDGTSSHITNGTNGVDGSSCNVISINNGAEISCDDGSSITLLNGINGSSCEVTQLLNGIKVTCGNEIGYVYNGEDGATSAFTVTEVINPCGDYPGHFDEVLLKMSNGEILAHFSHGNLQFLTLLTDGNYVTTDKQACNFNVTNGVVTW